MYVVSSCKYNNCFNIVEMDKNNTIKIDDNYTDPQITTPTTGFNSVNNETNNDNNHNQLEFSRFLVFSDDDIESLYNNFYISQYLSIIRYTSLFAALIFMAFISNDVKPAFTQQLTLYFFNYINMIIVRAVDTISMMMIIIIACNIVFLYNA